MMNKSYGIGNNTLEKLWQEGKDSDDTRKGEVYTFFGESSCRGRAVSHISIAQG